MRANKGMEFMLSFGVDTRKDTKIRFGWNIIAFCCCGL